MLRNLKFFSIILFCLVNILYISINHGIVPSKSNKQIPRKNIGKIKQNRKPLYDDNFHMEIQQTIQNQRRKIEVEMRNYNYLQGNCNETANFSDLVLELGGIPLRNIIVATWRSGSTFLGDILNSHPATYYHYEPLLDFKIIQIRGPPYGERAVDVIRNLLNCRYSDLHDYLKYGKKFQFLFKHNKRLWEQCIRHPRICWIPEFLRPFCRLFPFQSMKIVRLRLRLLEELLDDKRLNIRVLLLIRDPRGTLQSRKHRQWCPGNPDCDEPALLCADLLLDYSASKRFSVKYPDRFSVIRYEDLSLDPYGVSKQIFDFYGLDFHPKVVEFLDTHTKVNVGGVSSTFRDSKSAPFHWRQDLSHDEVRAIQDACEPAMKHWGYVKAENASHQCNFNPILNFSLIFPNISKNFSEYEPDC